MYLNEFHTRALHQSEYHSMVLIHHFYNNLDLLLFIIIINHLIISRRTEVVTKKMQWSVTYHADLKIHPLNEHVNICGPLIDYSLLLLFSWILITFGTKPPSGIIFRNCQILILMTSSVQCKQTIISKRIIEMKFIRFDKIRWNEIKFDKDIIQ